MNSNKDTMVLSNILLSMFFVVNCARADVLGAAQYREERAVAIQKLITELDIASDDHRIAEICFILGEMRAEEAVDVLILRLQFDAPADISRDPYRVPSWWNKPAQEALIKIGAGAFPSLLERVANTDDMGEQSAALKVMRIVLHRLHGESVSSPDGSKLLKSVLEIAMELETDPKSRQRLKDAIDRE